MNRKIYENGFRIIHNKSNISSSIASIQVFCDVGSINEPEISRGSAHFIEHMCFKGTQKLKSSADINKIFVDQTGSMLNAFTDRRYTCYYVNTHKNNTKLCINTLADMVLNSKFDKKEYMKERDVVREEAVKDEDDFELLAFTNADKQIYAGSPYENTVDELKYHVGKHILKYENILDIYKQYYVPSNMILSVCSSILFDDICKMVEKSDFVKTTRREPKIPLNLYVTPQFDIVYNIQKKATNPTHLCIGFRTCSLSHPDKYAIKLLKTILGDNSKMNNRMFTILREDNGLTYTSYAYSDFFEHMGDFKLYAECDTNKFLKNGDKMGVFPLLINMIADLLKHGVTEEEIKTAKTFIQSTQQMKSENADIIAKYNGKNEIFGLINAPEYKDKFEALIKPITKAHIDSCIKKYFKKDGMVISIVSSKSWTEKQLNIREMRHLS
jgi:predicted Zn-dependent peptidase